MSIDKRIDYEIQGGVKNFRPSEMVTVPKIAKSSPNTPTAKLAYITPEEEKILVDLNLYGSLKGKPNRGPGGIPSLEGDLDQEEKILVALEVVQTYNLQREVILEDLMDHHP